MTPTRTPSTAALAAARAALVSAGTFGNRVFRDMAPAGTAYPFAILTVISAESSYEHQGRPETVRLRAMCISDDASEADSGAFSMESALNLRGTQQTATGYLDASAGGWNVVIVRKLRDQTPPVERDENREIFRAGMDLSFKLERA